MEDFTLKIEGYETVITINKVIFESFKDVEFIHKKNNEITLKNDYFSEDYKVPNVCRYGLIKTDSQEYNLLPNENKNLYSSAFNDRILDDNFITKNKLPTIILILESPHKDEYDYFPKFTPKAPAQGVTGTQICEKFEQIINNHIDKLNLKESEYRIFIINPIPYQTSLFYCHQKKLVDNYKIIRDLVWEILWENGVFKDEFIELIKKINPQIIINACTKNLKNNIDEILNIIGFDRKYHLNHPANWGCPDGKYNFKVK